MIVAPSRFLPRPRLSLALMVMWVLLESSISFATIFFGALLGWLIPFITHQLWPEDYRPMRYLRFLRFILVVLVDILVASIHVARLILGPHQRLRPAFVTFPLELEDNFAITILASTISLTPGTVSSNISLDRKYLLIHALDVESEAELVDTIRRRYETPIREIFQ